MPKIAEPKISENTHQRMLFEWAALNERKYPELWFLHAIANGGSRHKFEAYNLKLTGVKAGVSDIFLPVARHGFHGLYIELKSKGGKISDKQQEWIDRVREQDYMAVVCYGFDEAREVLEKYIN